MTDQDEWMISFLDDHSGFLPGSRIHHNPTKEHAIKLLEESVKQYVKPNLILADLALSAASADFSPRWLLYAVKRTKQRELSSPAGYTFIELS